MVVGDLATSVDVAVIGAGPAGLATACAAAQRGKAVVLVDPQTLERNPRHHAAFAAHTLRTLARQMRQQEHFAAQGLLTGQIAVDLSAVQRWCAEQVAQQAYTLKKELEKYGVEIVQGQTHFVDHAVLNVESEYEVKRYVFAQAIIATGTAPLSHPDLPYDDTHILTPTQAWQLDALPADLTIIGHNAVAAEIASTFAQLGVAVTLVLPKGNALLEDFVPLAGELVAAAWAKVGIKIVEAPDDIREVTKQAEKTVVALGEQPNVADLALDLAGVQTDTIGFVPVNAQMQSNIAHLYAVGAVTGASSLANVAHKQGQVAAAHLCGEAVTFAPQAIPRVAWTDPEVAMVGVTPAEAETLGYTTTQTQLAWPHHGFMADDADCVAHFVTERTTDLLLGITFIGTGAATRIGEAALALEMGATLTDLVETLSS